MNALTETKPQEMDQDAVQTSLDLLTGSLRSQSDMQISEAAAQAMVADLSHPADMIWTLGRVAALLNPYFDKATPQGIREIEAEDWAEAIKGSPKWAIERACRWWKSASNPDRRKRPLEGDIVLRIRRETEAVRVAKSRLDRGWGNVATSQTQETSEPSPQITDAQRAETQAILAEFAKRKNVA